MDKFTPTHKIIDRDRVILVQEIVGDDEFCTKQDFDDFFPDPCVLGSYGLDEFNPNIVLIRCDRQDPEFGEIVSWNQSQLTIKRICIACHSEKVVKNGKNKCGTQRYQCKDCQGTFTGTTMGRRPIGDRAMTNAEHQAKFRGKGKG